MSIIYTILMFGVIIFIHELGHFTVARLSGVTIHEFSLGMGPAIFKRKRKDTTYAIRLFPIGGYVSMEGEDAESDDENAFNKKPILKKMAIVLAGAFMNLLLGLVIMTVFYSTKPAFNSTTVAEFAPKATTQETGLQSGDKILKMNKTNVISDQDIVSAVARDPDGIIDIRVLRDGKKIELKDVKFDVSGSGAEKTVNFDFSVMPVQKTPLSLISYSFRSTVSNAKNSWASIGDLFTGKLGVKDLSGPVGVGKVVGQVSNQGLINLLKMTAFISISIGMFNLLPFPALDGGRFVFLIIEAIRRKPVNPKIEGYVNGAGLILLLGLMVFVTFKDILGLF